MAGKAGGAPKLTRSANHKNRRAAARTQRSIRIVERQRKNITSGRISRMPGSRKTETVSTICRKLNLYQRFQAVMTDTRQFRVKGSVNSETRAFERKVQTGVNLQYYHTEKFASLCGSNMLKKATSNS